MRHWPGIIALVLGVAAAGAGIWCWLNWDRLRLEWASARVAGAESYEAARDEIALPLLFDLLKEEGLCLGGSSGINVGGAVSMAKELGPGHTVVTVLGDSGQRYQSKLYNPEFLRARGLPFPDWLA